jgi:hypothetical protein
MQRVVTALGERKRETLELGIALGVLLATAPTLVRAGSVGWEQGLLYAISSTLASVLPGNIDVPVVIIAGLISGWLVLFALDSTKRIQTLLLVPVVGLVFVFLGRFDHVVDAIERTVVPYAGAVVITVLGTGLTTYRLRLRKTIRHQKPLDFVRLVQFPAATFWMYALMTAVILVVTLQYPFVVRTPPAPSPAVVVISGVLSIVSLGIFVKYTDEKDITFAVPEGATGRETLVYVFGGLYFVAKGKYSGTPLDEQSRDNLDSTINDPTEMMERGFDDVVGFRYLPDDILRRRVLLRSRNLTTGEIDLDVVEHLGDARGYKAVYYLWALGVRVLPKPFRNVALKDDLISEWAQTDAILFVVPYPEEGDNGHERSIRVLVDAARLLYRNTRVDVKVVVAHADRAKDSDDETLDYDTSQGRDLILQRLRDELSDEASREAVQNLREESGLKVDIYPVSGMISPGGLRGFDSILRRF